MQNYKILFFTETEYISQEINNSFDVTIKLPFRAIPQILKYFRILHLNSKLSFKSIWYIKLGDEINSYDLIILSATNFTIEFAKYIEKKVSFNQRLIYWYWNPVRPQILPNFINDRWEKWSFDIDDCKTFKMKYNCQYYSMLKKKENSEIMYDILFVGFDKGRKIILKKCEDIFKKLNLNYLFHIVNENFMQFKNKRIYKKKISYLEVVDLISESKSILEIMQENQSGLTLRTMEALFYEKKLITNNSNIKKYDFYHPNNIFILNEDSESNLADFLILPYATINEQIINNYKFERWLNRIVNNIEFKYGE